MGRITKLEELPIWEISSGDVKVDGDRRLTSNERARNWRICAIENIRSRIANPLSIRRRLNFDHINVPVTEQPPFTQSTPPCSSSAPIFSSTGTSPVSGESSCGSSNSTTTNINLIMDDSVNSATSCADQDSSSRTKWNFDFQNETPIPGEWQWMKY